MVHDSIPASTAQPDAGTAAAEAAIRAAIARFIRAYAAGDADGVMACYAADLVKVRHGAAPESRAVTGSRIRAALARARGSLDVTVDEILVSGGLAVARGTFTVTLEPLAGGARETFERRYVEVWRNEDGRWLVARTMDNVGPDGP